MIFFSEMSEDQLILGISNTATSSPLSSSSVSPAYAAFSSSSSPSPSGGINSRMASGGNLSGSSSPSTRGSTPRRKGKSITQITMNASNQINGNAMNESDSGYSMMSRNGSTSPSSTNSRNVNSRQDRDKDLLPDDVLLLDSEAGPDTADEIFKDPSSFDFLSQHGDRVPGGISGAAALARESLYVKFDPLIAGRQSIMPPKMNTAQEEEEDEQDDNLIAMASPTHSPAHKSQIKSNTELKFSNTASSGAWGTISSKEHSNRNNERKGERIITRLNLRASYYIWGVR